MRKPKRWKSILLGLVTVVGGGFGVNIMLPERANIHCIIQLGETYQIENGATIVVNQTTSGILLVDINPLERR